MSLLHLVSYFVAEETWRCKPLSHSIDQNEEIVTKQVSIDSRCLIITEENVAVDSTEGFKADTSPMESLQISFNRSRQSKKANIVYFAKPESEEMEAAEEKEEWWNTSICFVTLRR